MRFVQLITKVGYYDLADSFGISEFGNRPKKVTCIKIKLADPLYKEVFLS